MRLRVEVLEQGGAVFTDADSGAVLDVATFDYAATVPAVRSRKRERVGLFVTGAPRLGGRLRVRSVAVLRDGTAITPEAVVWCGSVPEGFLGHAGTASITVTTPGNTPPTPLGDGVGGVPQSTDTGGGVPRPPSPV